MHSRRKNRVTLALAGFAFFFTAAPFALAQSQTNEDRLRQLNSQIDASRQQREQVQGEAREEEAYVAELAGELVLRAERMRLQEDVLLALQAELEQINADISEARISLVAGRERLGQLIAAMQRLSQHPPELVFIKPDDSLSTVQTASLLSAILPRIREQASALRTEMDALSALRVDALAKEATERGVLMTLRATRDEMSALLTERQTRLASLVSRDSELARAIANMTREAQSLENLLEQLENSDTVSRATPRLGSAGLPNSYPTSKPISQARGELVFPSSGRTIRRFGAQEDVGRARGITIKTAVGAQVSATWDGRVVFAGPFRDYGQVLIIAHGEGYHSLLAGMENIYGQVGQWVLAGEPIGSMALVNGANNNSNPTGNVNDSETLAGQNKDQNGSRLDLYLELRRAGTPINPAPWLARPRAQGQS